MFKNLSVITNYNFTDILKIMWPISGLPHYYSHYKSCGTRNLQDIRGLLKVPYFTHLYYQRARLNIQAFCLNRRSCLISKFEFVRMLWLLFALGQALGQSEEAHWVIRQLLPSTLTKSTESVFRAHINGSWRAPPTAFTRWHLISSFIFVSQ